MTAVMALRWCFAAYLRAISSRVVCTEVWRDLIGLRELWGEVKLVNHGFSAVLTNSRVAARDVSSVA